MARATQRPHGMRKARDAEIRPVMGCGEEERAMGWDGRPKAPTAPWDWETSRHGVVNHGPTMSSLATGSRENALNTGTAVRCLQG